MEKEQLFTHIEQDRDRLRELAKRIWETPELGLHEHESAQMLIDALEADGFDVEAGVGDMPTAFTASYGEGGPTIGILGEFDALPGLSQTVTAEREPVDEGSPGHGCGHNLFGVGALGGAVAVKRAIEQGDLEGTISYYGCPAEETLVGKVFMARAGVFDDLDVALTWHPNTVSTPWLKSSLAMDSIQFTFDGVSAHAAAAPESGRSALDAVELMNTGTEYMREHISEEARVHYVITEGGDAPNVVPPTATVWYYVRAPTRGEVERISDWIKEIAEGAASMTQTAVERRFVTGCYDFLPNQTVTDAVWNNIQAVGPINYTEDDQEFAADLQETLAEDTIEAQLADIPEKYRTELEGHALHPEPIETYDEDQTLSGSTDVGDVSWITPTAQFTAASWPVGTPPHTWQAVAANGGFGLKSVIFAAKVFAGTAYDLLTDPTMVDNARREFNTATDDRAYETPLATSVTPPFDMSG
jgi:aminobenzoyl-glutamate utilization protein B